MARRVLITLASIGAIGVLLFSTFRSTSVCVECGCRSSATDFQLPLLPVTYWRWQGIENTLLSLVGRDLGFLEPHAHDWKMIHGGGNGVLCAIGYGGELDRTVRSREVTQFLLDTSRYRGRDEAGLWFDRALDYRKSRAVSDWISLNSYPHDGFAAALEYDSWRRRADLEWSEYVERNANRWR